MIARHIFLLVFLLLLFFSCHTTRKPGNSGRDIYIVHFSDVSFVSTASGSYSFRFTIDSVINTHGQEELQKGLITASGGGMTVELIEELTTGESLPGRDGYSEHFVLRPEEKSYILKMRGAYQFELSATDGSFSIQSKDYSLPASVVIDDPPG